MKIEFVCAIDMATSASFYLPGQFNHLYPLALQIYSQKDIEKMTPLRITCFISLSSKYQKAASAASRYI